MLTELRRAQGLRRVLPFVEFAQPRGQVGGKAFRRHLFEAARDLRIASAQRDVESA